LIWGTYGDWFVATSGIRRGMRDSEPKLNYLRDREILHEDCSRSLCDIGRNLFRLKRRDSPLHVYGYGALHGLAVPVWSIDDWRFGPTDCAFYMTELCFKANCSTWVSDADVPKGRATGSSQERVGGVTRKLSIRENPRSAGMFWEMPGHMGISSCLDGINWKIPEVYFVLIEIHPFRSVPNKTVSVTSGCVLVSLLYHESRFGWLTLRNATFDQIHELVINWMPPMLKLLSCWTQICYRLWWNGSSTWRFTTRWTVPMDSFDRTGVSLHIYRCSLTHWYPGIFQIDYLLAKTVLTSDEMFRFVWHGMWLKRCRNA